MFRCFNKCDKILSCGHKCKGNCFLCLNSTLHFPCFEECEKILYCGHKCAKKCIEICECSICVKDNLIKEKDLIVRHSIINYNSKEKINKKSEPLNHLLDCGDLVVINKIFKEKGKAKICYPICYTCNKVMTYDKKYQNKISKYINHMFILNKINKYMNNLFQEKYPFIAEKIPIKYVKLYDRYIQDMNEEKEEFNKTRSKKPINTNNSKFILSNQLREKYLSFFVIMKEVKKIENSTDNKYNNNKNLIFNFCKFIEPLYYIEKVYKLLQEEEKYEEEYLFMTNTTVILTYFYDKELICEPDNDDESKEQKIFFSDVLKFNDSFFEILKLKILNLFIYSLILIYSNIKYKEIFGLSDEMNKVLSEFLLEDERKLLIKEQFMGKGILGILERMTSKRNINDGMESNDKIIIKKLVEYPRNLNSIEKCKICNLFYPYNEELKNECQICSFGIPFEQKKYNNDKIKIDSLINMKISLLKPEKEIKKEEKNNDDEDDEDYFM